MHIFYGPDWQQQSIVQAPPPTTVEDRFGFALLLHDVDGDGLDDLLVGAPGAKSDLGLTTEGRVWIWSGTDLADRQPGRPLLLPAPPRPNPLLVGHFFGFSLAAADFDADGVPELCVGEGDVPNGSPPDVGRGAIRLYDRTLTLVGTVKSPPGHKKFGDLLYKGDLTGDGNHDLIVSAYGSTFVTPPIAEPDLSSAGAVVVLRGPDYSEVLATLWSPVPVSGGLFGRHSQVLDVDLDGDLDIVVGDPGTVLSDTGERVRIFHGPDFSEIQSLASLADATHNMMGWEIAAPDVDGDGLPEILAAAVVGSGAGSIHVFSPRTLTADAATLSVSQGGRVTFSLRMPAQAGSVYLGLLSASESGAGTILGKGSFVPLKPDVATLTALDFVGTPLLPGFTGRLDDKGEATLALDWPAGFATEQAGNTFTFAVLTFPEGRPGPGSSAVTLELLP